MIESYPFAALVGQEDLREALLVNAVDPSVGGVLVRGERGTAKSTAARALAPLLPDVDGRPVRLVELPAGATADRLVGSLDVERALSGEPALQPGLLAEAHRGILYVDEVNLLGDHLVDLLLDAAALGVVHVERDGLSARHDARFVLVGTMNPEEGELRPQLLDRFGLSVEVRGFADPGLRAEVVRRRLAFDADPTAFAVRFADEQRALAARIAAAQRLLADVRLSDRMLALITAACARLGVDGLRGDLVTARTAKTLAALDGADEVTPEHVHRAARLALAHRTRKGPLDRGGGLSEEQLREALDGDGPDDGDDPDDEPPPPDGVGRMPSNPPNRVGPPPATQAPAGQASAPALTLPGRGQGTAGRRARSTGAHAPAVDARPFDGTRLDLPATLRAAALGGGRVRPEHARTPIRGGRESSLTVFVVDASGSMAARRRMALVKTAALALLEDAYARRDRVAVIAFRDERAELLLEPTGSVEQAAQALRALPTGGRTPLAAGLDRANELIAAERRRDGERRTLAVLVTDGRATDLDAALQAAGRLGATADGVVVIDTETGGARLGLARRIADAAGAIDVHRLDALGRAA